MNRARNNQRQRASRVQPPRRIYKVKIALEGIRPPIYRQLYVADDTPLDKLHEIFQCAMGWENYHLHSFQVGNRGTGFFDQTGIAYGPKDPDWGFEDNLVDEQGMRLRDIAPQVGSKFHYEYDFGDGWMHLVKVEEIVEQTAGLVVPSVLAGKRACPPEDCGGSYGYENFLRAIRNPAHKEHRNMLEWIGGDFDPEHFDVDEVNLDLQRYQIIIT